MIPFIFEEKFVKGIYRIFGFDPSVQIFDDAKSLGDFSRCLADDTQERCYQEFSDFPYSPFSRYFGFIYRELSSFLPVILEIVILFLLYKLVSKLNLPMTIYFLLLINGPLLFLYERGNIDQLSLILGLTLSLNMGPRYKSFFFASIIPICDSFYFRGKIRKRNI